MQPPEKDPEGLTSPSRTHAHTSGRERSPPAKRCLISSHHTQLWCDAPPLTPPPPPPPCPLWPFLVGPSFCPPFFLSCFISNPLPSFFVAGDATQLCAEDTGFQRVVEGMLIQMKGCSFRTQQHLMFPCRVPVVQNSLALKSHNWFHYFSNKKEETERNN